MARLAGKVNGDGATVPSPIVPGRRQVVGTTNTRVLEKIVRTTDVAHVVLEWQHRDS